MGVLAFGIDPKGFLEPDESESPKPNPKLYTVHPNP